MELLNALFHDNFERLLKEGDVNLKVSNDWATLSCTIYRVYWFQVICIIFLKHEIAEMYSNGCNRRSSSICAETIGSQSHFYKKQQHDSVFFDSLLVGLLIRFSVKNPSKHSVMVIGNLLTSMSESPTQEYKIPSSPPCPTRWVSKVESLFENYRNQQRTSSVNSLGWSWRSCCVPQF